MNTIQEEKQNRQELTKKIKENEDKYISGEWDITPILEQTDVLYNKTRAGQKTSVSTEVPSTIPLYLQDSDLLQLETKIVRQSARQYKVYTLHFDPKAFAGKVKHYFGVGSSDDDSQQSRKQPLHMLWTKLGQCSKENMYTVPNFSFMYGTFDAEPVVPVKRKRKPYVKDKVGNVTKPQTMNLSEVVDGTDPMIDDATKVLSCFLRLIECHKRKAMCFYEFVIDPASFARTVEHIFLVSLLLNMGHLTLFSDDSGLPFLKPIQPSEKEEFSTTVTQSALSLSVEEWKEIVKAFNFTSSVIPPRS